MAGGAHAQPIPGASYNFNAVAPTSTSGSGGFVSAGTYDNWQVQGGGDGTFTLTGGIDTNGQASGATPAGNALFATWDQSGTPTFNFIQVTNYYANPTSTAGGASGPGQVQVSFDMRVDGSASATPVQVEISQAGAGNYTSQFSPVLTEGAYTHVVYTLDMGTTSGTFSDTANFDQLRFNMNAGGFGLDAGNTVHMDNFVMEVVVPEPGGAALLGLLPLLLKRRRPSSL
jgi:hypothetical protein